MGVYTKIWDTPNELALLFDGTILSDGTGTKTTVWTADGVELGIGGRRILGSHTLTTGSTPTGEHTLSYLMGVPLNIAVDYWRLTFRIRCNLLNVIDTSGFMVKLLFTNGSSSWELSSGLISDALFPNSYVEYTTDWIYPLNIPDTLTTSRYLLANQPGGGFYIFVDTGNNTAAGAKYELDWVKLEIDINYSPVSWQSGVLKYYNGSTWVAGILKRFNGSTWDTGILKKY